MDKQVVLNYTKDNALSFLCQAMFDETLRLRRASYRERASIRKFLIEAFQVISVNSQDMQYPVERSDDMKQEIQQSNK